MFWGYDIPSNDVTYIFFLSKTLLILIFSRLALDKKKVTTITQYHPLCEIKSFVRFSE